MNIHESAEDYLERILMLQEKNGKVRSIDIATDMKLSKPSVSVAMKRLREDDYIEVSAQGHITLTEKGQKVADKIYFRHTTLSDFLMKLGVEESVAKQDACKIEHDLSEETFDCICAHLRQLEQ